MWTWKSKNPKIHSPEKKWNKIKLKGRKIKKKKKSTRRFRYVAYGLVCVYYILARRRSKKDYYQIFFERRRRKVRSFFWASSSSDTHTTTRYAPKKPLANSYHLLFRLPLVQLPQSWKNKVWTKGRLWAPIARVPLSISCRPVTFNRKKRERKEKKNGNLWNGSLVFVEEGLCGILVLKNIWQRRSNFLKGGTKNAVNKRQGGCKKKKAVG